MSIKPLSLNRFDGGLNTGSVNSIKNNQFSKLVNFFYNNDKQPQTRRGYKRFADSLANPITSYFFYQNDGTLATKAVCHSGTEFYELNAGGTAWVSKKTGLTQYETTTGKTTWRTKRDYAVYKNIIYMCDGVNNYAKWDGTTYTEYAAQPKIRYISYLQDSLYGAGDDTNPNTLYYTPALPADGNTINTYVLIVGGDENGQINGISELQTNILAFKSNNIYAVDIVNQTALPIDSQGGGYSDRSIARVANSLVYFTDTGVDTLKTRQGVSGSNALGSDSLSVDVKELIDQIKEFNYNAQVAFYSKKANNYYFSYDSNGDNVPDSTLVYSSLTKGRSTYTFPNIYDYGSYIGSDQVEKMLFAAGGQMFEFESGYDDDGADIEYELETKAYDSDTPGVLKTYDYIDVTGLKSKGTTIDISALVEGEVASFGTVTDLNITVDTVYKTLGSSILGGEPLTGGEDTSGVDLYQYNIRLPMFATGNDIAINMKSVGGVWTLQKARISVDEEPVDVFYTDNIL